MNHNRAVPMIAGVLTILATAITPTAVRAQEGFTEQCNAATNNSQLRAFCTRVGQGIEIVQPRLGIAMSGGNPVMGTASTLGFRLGTVPRFSIGARATAALVETPPLEDINGGDDLKFPLPSVNIDASVGVFDGLAIAPTVGGFGSIDLLGSVGMVPLPKGEGFGDDAPVSWAAGARLGLLRESFTAPGISVSGMYRHIGTLSYGDSTLQADDAAFSMDDMTALSFRGAISKRIPLVGLGVTLGAGYDKYTGSASFAVRDPSLLSGTVIRITNDDLETDRMSYFANASMTFLIVNLVGEIGIQNGADDNAFPASASDLMGKGGLFGGIAVRIAL